MNPIEKAVAKADQIIAFNRELERLSALSAHGVKIVNTIDACYCDEADPAYGKPHNHRGRRLITLDDSIAQAKREILTFFTLEERQSVGSFSDLHNLCDANTLGFLCDGSDVVFFVDAQGTITDLSDPNHDRWVEFGNDVQNAVNAWIVSGAHKSEA